MAIEQNDLPNRVFIDQYDSNKIVVEEQVTHIEVSLGGPQGQAGITGADGPQGPQGEHGRYTVSETAPIDPQSGDAWFRSSSAQMYLYYDSFWVETSTSYIGPRGASGVMGVQNIDGGSASSTYLQNQLVDGGSAASMYTNTQLINGGMAGTF